MNNANTVRLANHVWVDYAAVNHHAEINAAVTEMECQREFEMPLKLFNWRKIQADFSTFYVKKLMYGTVDHKQANPWYFE